MSVTVKKDVAEWVEQQAKEKNSSKSRVVENVLLEKMKEAEA